MHCPKQLIAIVLLIVHGLPATAQTATPAETASWTAVGGDPGGSRYSPLRQIDRKNVWRLERAWAWRHGDFARFPERRAFSGFHATPILLPEAAGGALVLCTPFNRLVALDPITGKERWSFDPQIQVTETPQRLQCLGVSYWRDQAARVGQQCAHRILAGTNDRRLLAVDAATGKPCADFGTNGQVDVNPLFADTKPAPTAPWDTQFSAPPVVVNGVLAISHIDNRQKPFGGAASGAVRAFDVRTGRFRWSFELIPTDGANTWNMLSIDEKRDLVFVSTSSHSPIWFGGARAGDNPYANSVVALRASTGKVVWHFQTVHHDVWNWDSPSQPLLVDVPKGGRRVPAVVVLTAQSLVFVLDRATGEPLFPVEERSVPTDGVPGNVLSKTQPFPVKPPPLGKTRLTPDDAWGLTFWDQKRCRDLIAGARHGDLYTPPSDQGWIRFPGSAGGITGTGAYDPERNLLVTSVSQLGLYVKRVQGKATPWTVEQRTLLGSSMLPCTSPPWSTLVGVDLAAGEIRWSVPLGTVDKLAAVSIPPLKWGAPVTGGPIITAGGIVFIGATSDARLRAFDTETGAEVWSTPLPASAHANPMTYERDGRQFVVIAAGGDMSIDAKAIDDYLVAYALPTKYLESVQ